MQKQRKKERSLQGEVSLNDKKTSSLPMALMKVDLGNRGTQMQSMLRNVSV